MLLTIAVQWRSGRDTLLKVFFSAGVAVVDVVPSTVVCEGSFKEMAKIEGIWLMVRRQFY